MAFRHLSAQFVTWKDRLAVAINLLSDEKALSERLRAGDEAAFVAIVEAWGPGMLRLARSHVTSQAIAEEVVQEAWVGILRGLDRFEGRSSLKTWAFRIVSNTAKTRGARESRSTPFSSVGPDGEERGPVVDADRFQSADGRFPGGWQTPPKPWPQQQVEQAETRDAVLAAIAALPPRQREIITLRDIEGFTSPEACNALEIEETKPTRAIPA